MGDGLAEWIITTPGGAQLLLQMAKGAVTIEP